MVAGVLNQGGHFDFIDAASVSSDEISAGVELWHYLLD